MRTTKNSIVTGTLFIAGLLSAGLLISGCAQQGGSTIKIALVAPLTGDLAAMGQGMQRAAEMAVEEANAAKRFGETTLELAVYDDGGDPKEAVNMANQVISSAKVLGVVGHLTSDCSIPASQVYAKRNLVMITPSSTNPRLTNQGLRNVFRVCTTDDVQGNFAANYVFNRLKARKAAIIHDKTAYGQGNAEEFKKQFQANGGEVISFDGIDVGDKDFKALLARIKTSSPQLVYFGGVYTEYGLISRQAKELGLNVPVFSDDGSCSSEYIRIGGASTEGNFVSMVGVPAEQLQKAGNFLEAFKKKYEGVDAQPYDPYTYEAASILIDAIEKAGRDRNAIIVYVAKVKFNGILGETAFDEKGDTLNKAVSVYKVNNGTFKYAE